MPGEKKQKRCDACRVELHSVFTFPGETLDDDYQLQSAAWVEMRGGYGMAIDNLERQLAGEPDLRILLCESCLRSAMSHLGLVHALDDANE